MFQRIILSVIVLLCLAGPGYGETVAMYSVEHELRVSIRNSAPTKSYGVVATVAEAPDWAVFESKVDTVADSLLPGETKDAVFNFHIDRAEPARFEISVRVLSAEGIWVRQFQVLAGITDLPKRLKSTVLYQSKPNPFSSSTSICFNLAKSGEVELKVYDLSGRVVKTLISGVQSAGMHALNWHGDDSNDNRVPNGAYFLRFEGTKYSRTEKVILVR